MSSQFTIAAATQYTAGERASQRGVTSHSALVFPSPTAPEPARDKRRDPSHGTLGGRASRAQIDGHAMPSMFAATPAASTKAEKLMDTLYGSIQQPNPVTSQQFVARATLANELCRRSHGELFSTRVSRKESRKASSINESPKIGRHTFALFGTNEEAYRE